MSASYVIRVENVYKRFKSNPVPTLDHIRFEVNQGEVIGLLGPNGAGKTTLIKILCGLLKPDQGDVSIFGMDYRRQHDQIKRLIGVVPQDIALFPTLTAYENIRYFGKLQGLKDSMIKERTSYFLHNFGLSGAANRQVGQFSGGMNRIINLIAGIIHDPRVLFLDEPTAGVDVHSRSIILEKLIDLKNGGMTLVYTSHLLHEAQDICSRIVVMDKGKVLIQGPPAELTASHGLNRLEEFFLKITTKPPDVCS